MKIVSTIYSMKDRVKNVVNNKFFSTIFISLMAFFLFFGTMNTYAVDKLEVDYSGIKNFSNITTGVELGEDNQNTFNLQTIATSLHSIVQIAAPVFTEGGDDLEGADVPEDMQVGLLGTADIYVDYAYQYQPNINIGQHLAQEWVPGYDDSNSGIYAADYQSGYDELMDSGISNLWSKFRNLAYLMFVVVMIVVGFMIMFRSKLGGQTLVTLGNTIPNIIIALVLVTFSFAIVGLVIDLGGLLTTVLASLMEGDLASIQSIGSLMGSVFNGTGEDIAGVLAGGVGGILGGIGVVTLAALPVLGWSVAGAGIVTLLLLVVIIAVVFVGVVKLLITLYKAYFGIILNTVLAPLRIMIGAFPGNKHMIMNWFGDILRNVLVFPVVFFIVNIPIVIESAGDVVLNFPEKLTYAELGSDGIDITATAGVFMFILKIFVLYYAAQAPKFIEAFIPSTTPKPVMEGMAAANESLSKIPVIGSLFK